MREYDKREGNPGKDRGSTFKYRGEDPEAISTGLNDNYADACESIYAALLDTGESVVYARATRRVGGKSHTDSDVYATHFEYEIVRFNLGDYAHTYALLRANGRGYVYADKYAGQLCTYA